MIFEPSELRQFLCASRFAPFADDICAGLRRAVWMHPDYESRTRSKFGGLPALPDGVAWPASNGREIEFLLQVFLSECATELNGDMTLPDQGVLFFFYDFQEMPDGVVQSDSTAFRVIFEPDEERCVDAGQSKRTCEVYPEKRIRFDAEWTLPWALLTALQDNPMLDEAFAELEERFVDYVWQQLLGHAAQVQTPPELDCLRAETNDGVDEGERPGRHDIASDWLLLAQLNSYPEELGWAWLAEGSLYFMIRRADLAELRFDRVQCIGQCS